jgi:hypothetical protein
VLYVLYSALMAARDAGVPAWWPYAAELPDWDVWRDICGLVYAQLRDVSPPVLVRGEDAVDLRDAIRREEFLRSCAEAD